MTGSGGGRYRYDGNLKRVKEVVGGVSVYSIYDRSGALIMRDNTTAGTKTDYLTVAGQTFARLTNGVATYPINDHLGTALWVAAQNGSIPASQTYNYGPFGEVLAGSGAGRSGEQGYTGHVEDASGLTYMQARYYDPVIGRFIQPDPIGYADGLNIYAYVGNDPLNFTDPAGTAGTESNDNPLGKPPIPEPELLEVVVCANCSKPVPEKDPFTRGKDMERMGDSLYSVFTASKGWGFNTAKITQFNFTNSASIGYLAPERSIERRDPNLSEQEELVDRIYINHVNGDIAEGKGDKIKFDDPGEDAGPPPDPINVGDPPVIPGF